MSVALPIGRLARYLAWMVTALVAADVAVQFARHGLHHGRLHGLVPMFDLDVEQNVPTWYQSMSLLIVAGLLAMAWRSARGRRDPMAWRWAVLSALATWLSIDESARIHEAIGAVLQQRFEPGSPMVYAWVLPYGAIAAAMLVWYLPWLKALPAATRSGFVVAASVYVGGALGMELVEASVEYAGHLTSLAQAITTGIEETLEMTGVVLTVRALARHLTEEGTRMTMVASSRPRAEVASARVAPVLAAKARARAVQLR